MKGNHLKHMLIGAVGLLGVLLAVGVPLGRALPLAISLACPLMMVWMMVMMGRGDHAHGSRDAAQTSAVPAPREPSEIDLTKGGGTTRP